MTQDEFFIALAATIWPRWKFWKPQWYVSSSGELRRGHVNQDCPISAVTGCRSDFVDPQRATVDRLHMDVPLGWSLWMASDYPLSEYPELRKKMMTALHLKEK